MAAANATVAALLMPRMKKTRNIWTDYSKSRPRTAMTYSVRFPPAFRV